MSLKFFRRKGNTKNRENGIKAILSMGNEGNHGSEPIKDSSNQDITSSPSSTRNNSLSSIALRASLNSPGLSSHRNLNPSHQMQIAEAIFDDKKPLKTRSRLSPTLTGILHDHEALSYFVQFMESRGSATKQIIRLWIQLECFQRFSKEFSSSETDFKMDAEGIWDKFLSGGKYKQLGISENLVDNIESKLNDNSSFVGETLFKDLAGWIENHLQVNYYEQYLKSYYFCKYQVNVLTSGHLRLADILYNDSTLFYFMEFMEHESMNHYIDFLVMAEHCRKTDCTKDDLLILYQRFFLPESPSYLEMSETIKCQTEKTVRSGDKHCFDKAMSIMMQYFEETYFQQFLSSQAFFSFLDESIKALQMNSEAQQSPSSSHQSRSRRNSGSSDRSGPLTSHNSLSSSALSVANRDSNKNSLLNLDDYDSIWKRDCVTDLQMASVDRLGKVVSYFQPEPNKTSSNGLSLSRAVKMFRQSSFEEKEKQELAYKVAQMIIDDVFSVTQASNL